MSNDLVTYTPPTTAEWQQTMELVKAVADTEFVPVAMRGKPAAVLASVLTGRELGIGPMQAIKHVGIIEGKPGLSAELMAGLVRRAGHKLRVITRALDEAEVEGIRADDPRHPLRVVWTLKDAERAGLCKIGNDGKPTARSKSNQPMPWEKYPDALLLARAISALCRAMFSDVLAGFSYTPEEIASAGEETEATWGDAELNAEQVAISESTLGAYVQDSGRLGGEDPIPAQPAGSSVPSLQQINLLRTVRAAKDLIYTSPPQFQALVPRAISALYQTDPHAWWDQTSKVDAWRQVLEYAVELADHEQHEMSAAGGSPQPAADQPSDPSRQGEDRGGPDEPQGGGDG